MGKVGVDCVKKEDVLAYHVSTGQKKAEGGRTSWVCGVREAICQITEPEVYPL